jgi:type 1 glutamine amidotransferase
VKGREQNVGGVATVPSAGAGSNGAAPSSGGVATSEAGTTVGGIAGKSNEIGGAPEVEAGAGLGGMATIDHYAPRAGSFKMLVYSATDAFRHASAIEAGKTMLQQIASEHDIEVVATDTNEHITETGLAQFELVFFLNTSGNVFSPQEQLVFEKWMTTQSGAFAGLHSAADTEFDWAFYKEVTGQYLNGQGAANTPEELVLEAANLSHPALLGLPNPWHHSDEWYLFNSHEQWSAKPGFQILARRTSNGHPVMWTREWAGFRAFYSSLGHDAAAFKSAPFQKNVTNGILWAVRREHALK